MQESGCATFLVHYEPESFFSPHTHDGEEEIYVIDGVFEGLKSMASLAYTGVQD